MKLENVKSILKDELHRLGIVAEEVDADLCFDYVIDQNQAPLRYHVHFNQMPHTIDVRVHWDLEADQLTSELLTFLSYLNSVEQYGHFYVENRDSKVYYKLSIFYRDFTPEIERTRRLFSIPVRAFGSGSNALRAILQRGEPVIDVYHWWIKEVLDTKEVQRTEAKVEGAVDQEPSSPRPSNAKPDARTAGRDVAGSINDMSADVDDVNTGEGGTIGNKDGATKGGNDEP